MAPASLLAAFLAAGCVPQPRRLLDLQTPDTQGFGAAMKQLLQSCWKPTSASGEIRPVLRIRLTVDGSLATPPRVENPQDDPAFTALAQSAVRAIERCTPVAIPDELKPLYPAWRDWRITFDSPAAAR
jgi:hypothetical protein